MKTIYAPSIAFFFVFLAGLASPAVAAPRDSRADLIKVSTRYLEGYSKVEHKAGDPDGVFIEDTVIPAVVAVVKSFKGSVPPGIRNEVHRFLIAGSSMASEELAGLAGEMYQLSPKDFCNDISKLSQSSQRLLVKQAGDGLMLAGVKHKPVRCS